MLALTRSTYCREPRTRLTSSAALEMLLELYQRRCFRSNTGHSDWEAFRNLMELFQSTSN